MTDSFYRKSCWPHVMWHEIICHHCNAFVGDPRPEVLDHFEAIRSACGGKPINITSGPRCAQYQAILAADGKHHAAVVNSPHVAVLFPDGKVWTMALDLQSPEVPAERIAEVAERLMPECGIGIKLYKGKFCHIDVAHLAPGNRWHKGRRW